MLQTKSAKALPGDVIDEALLLICPSSHKARPENVIGPNSSGLGIVAPQRNKFTLNFPISKDVGNIWRTLGNVVGNMGRLEYTIAKKTHTTLRLKNKLLVSRKPLTRFKISLHFYAIVEREV